MCSVETINKTEITETINYIIQWSMDDLKMFSERMEHGAFISSRQCYSPKYPSVVWELRFVRDKYHYGYIYLVQVCLKNLNETLNARSKIFIGDANKRLLKHINMGETLHFKNQIESRRYVLNIPELSFVEGSVFVYCTINFESKTDNSNDNYLDVNASQNLLKSMLKQETLADCVIKIGNENIKTHRCILAQNSKVFLRMFEQNGMLEAQNGEINIVDSSIECFLTMLKYFYSGGVDKTILEHLDENLFAIAHKYEVISLMELCENFMSSKIDLTNFNNRCLCAELYGLKVLEKACVEFIFVNRKSFLLSNEWKEFKETNGALANKLLELVVLNVF